MDNYQNLALIELENAGCRTLPFHSLLANLTGDQERIRRLYRIERMVQRSQREIRMSQVMYDALKEQEKATRQRSVFVFCNTIGQPLGYKNVINRVWYPLLRHLDLEKRRPYHCRHTAATMWLASGENLEWIARQMGHSTTEMLFRVYSRFVPNVTRQDGSACDRLLLQSGTTSPSAETSNS